MIHRILGTILGLALLAMVLIFTSILLAVGLATGLLLGGWIWWRGRGGVTGRRHRIVEGESRVVDDHDYHLRR